MHQQILKGTQAGQDNAVAKARTDTTPGVAAEEAAAKRIQEVVDAELSKAEPPSGESPSGGCTSDCSDQSQPKSGTFKGAGQSDTEW